MLFAFITGVCLANTLIAWYAGKTNDGLGWLLFAIISDDIGEFLGKIFKEEKK